MQTRQVHKRTLQSTIDLSADTAEFIKLLGESGTTEERELFDSEKEIIISRAPGRLDVMGGIADYSGSLVLQMPIREATHVALQRDQARLLKIVSLTPDRTRAVRFEMPLADFERDGKPVCYQTARDYFRRDAASHWAAYAAGVLLVLMRESEVRFTEGARLLIASSVPEGKGVSSSSALEVACMSAVCTAFNVELAPRDLALLCQKVENLIVGAPCGVMDQMASACGEEGTLLALVCQPAELQGTIRLPPDLAVWGLDSGVRHSVGEGDYGSVRTGAFMGYRIIAEVAGLKIAAQSEDGRIGIDDWRWNGYLSNVTPSEFEGSFADQLPVSITGAEFLLRYAGTTDKVTRIFPERTYAVQQATAHAVYEHFRVRAFAELLGREASERRNELLGELMYQSHASYERCGLGSSGTDLLVRLVREHGAELYGAKITGGGSGGTVAVLGRQDAAGAVSLVAEQYQAATNHKPYIFAGSSPGSAAFGHLKLSGI